MTVGLRNSVEIKGVQLANEFYIYWGKNIGERGRFEEEGGELNFICFKYQYLWDIQVKAAGPVALELTRMAGMET